MSGGLPQGLLLSGIPFRVFINDLPDIFAFAEHSLFDDDMKHLANNRNYGELQLELQSVERWAAVDQMEPAAEQCSSSTFKSSVPQLLAAEQCSPIVFKTFKLLGQYLTRFSVFKHLCVCLSDGISWKAHNDARLKKLNHVYYLLRKNVQSNVKTLTKLGLYKSPLLPVLLYGFLCVALS